MTTNLQQLCPVTSTQIALVQRLLGGIWKLVILWRLSEGIKRFGVLQSTRFSLIKTRSISELLTSAKLTYAILPAKPAATSGRYLIAPDNIAVR